MFESSLESVPQVNPGVPWHREFVQRRPDVEVDIILAAALERVQRYLMPYAYVKHTRGEQQETAVTLLRGCCRNTHLVRTYDETLKGYAAWRVSKLLSRLSEASCVRALVRHADGHRSSPGRLMSRDTKWYFVATHAAVLMSRWVHASAACTRACNGHGSLPRGENGDVREPMLVWSTHQSWKNPHTPLVRARQVLECTRHQSKA